eukprot:365925-Chlamydomonas_euryale.AAC.1
MGATRTHAAAAPPPYGHLRATAGGGPGGSLLGECCRQAAPWSARFQGGRGAARGLPAPMPPTLGLTSGRPALALTWPFAGPIGRQVLVRGLPSQ